MINLDSNAHAMPMKPCSVNNNHSPRIIQPLKQAILTGIVILFLFQSREEIYLYDLFINNQYYNTYELQTKI